MMAYEIEKPESSLSPPDRQPSLLLAKKTTPSTFSPVLAATMDSDSSSSSSSSSDDSSSRGRGPLADPGEEDDSPWKPPSSDRRRKRGPRTTSEEEDPASKSVTSTPPSPLQHSATGVGPPQAGQNPGVVSSHLLQSFHAARLHPSLLPAAALASPFGCTGGGNLSQLGGSKPPSKQQVTPFLPFGLPPHSHSLPELYPHALGAPQAAGGRLTGADVDTSASQEVLPLYANAAAAPSRLPAHKPVRLNQPKHPLAPSGTPVYFKYGEEHYPEETIPEAYTFTESDGTVCRYITNFLVYNKRGERLLPIEVLDQPRHGALVLYGSLLPASSVGSPLDASTLRQNRADRRRASAKSRRSDDDGPPMHPPYPVRVELSEWCIDYGQEPQNVPFIWLISRWDVYYRLEKPAGRYIPTFATAKMKFEVSTRVIKTLQFRPDFAYRELVDLLTAATRQERLKKRLREHRQRKKESRRLRHPALKGAPEDPGRGSSAFVYSPAPDDSGDECLGDEGGGTRSASFLDDDDVPSRKKATRPSWKVHHSLSSPEGTGVPIELSNGQVQPRTPWGAPFAVEGVRESTLLGLTDFLDSQMRNFLEGVGGAGGDCANLLETRFMQTLREKASLRRETLQLVEAKKRAIESMAAATAPFPHMGHHSPYELGSAAAQSPLVVLQVLQPIPVRHTLNPGTPVAQGALLGSPNVTIGFAGDAAGCLANPHHHQALLMLKTRHQEEQELSQLLQLLKEFSDPEDANGLAIFGHSDDEEDETLLDESSEDDDDDDQAAPGQNVENALVQQRLHRRGRPPKSVKREAVEDLENRRKRPRTAALELPTDTLNRDEKCAHSAENKQERSEGEFLPTAPANNDPPTIVS